MTIVLAAGCEAGHPGRVLVVVSSDYPVPAELSEVRVLAGPADDPDDRTGQAFVLTRVTPPPAGTHHIPLSLVVTPRGGDSDRRVEIIVEGRTAASGDVLIRSTRVLDGFRRGDTIVLPIFLSRNCEGTTCGVGRTCIDSVCESVEVDPGTLRIARDPGEELRMVDSGPRADGAGDAAMDSTMENGVPDTSMLDTEPPVGDADTSDGGVCGPPITLPHLVVEGPSTLFPLAPSPGMWAYNEPNVRRYDTYVEWTYTARPGCEIYRIEPDIPSGVPADPMIACTGTCATRRTWGANYEVYRNGSVDYDEIIVVDQSIAVDRLRLDLANAGETVTLMLSDWTSDVDASRDEAYVVFHTATFFTRPIP
jgi:hypothetical protein